MSWLLCWLFGHKWQENKAEKRYVTRKRYDTLPPSQWKAFCKLRMRKRRSNQISDVEPDSVRLSIRPEHPMNLCESIRKLPMDRLIEEGIVAPTQRHSEQD